MTGITPLISDRGGLPETVGPGGIILPIPPHVSGESRELPAPEDVTPWLEKIIELTDNAALYDQHCAAARAGAARYDPDNVIPRLVAFFQGIR